MQIRVSFAQTSRQKGLQETQWAGKRVVVLDRKRAWVGQQRGCKYKMTVERGGGVARQRVFAYRVSWLVPINQGVAVRSCGSCAEATPYRIHASAWQRKIAA